MPISCDPNARFSFTLKRDRGKPDAPRFFFRYLTVRQKRAYYAVGEAARAAETLGIDRVYEQLGMTLSGWEKLAGPDGAAVPFNAGNLKLLDDILTEGELWELCIAGSSELDEADRKNSDSPPSSSSA
jgi:hypothetical protein